MPPKPDAVALTQRDHEVLLEAVPVHAEVALARRILPLPVLTDRGLLLLG